MKKIIWSFLLFIISLNINCFAYTVRAGHPRIYLNSTNSAEISSRCANSNSDMYDRIIVDNSNGVEVKYSVSDASMAAGDRLIYIEKASIVYALGDISGYDYSGKHTPDEYGEKGKERLVYWATNNEGGELSFPSVLIGYDYFYSLMTSTERKTVVDEIIRAVGLFAGGAKTYTDFGSKAPGEHRWTMAGLAFYGDGANIGDGSQATYYNNKAIEYCNDFETYWKNGVMAAHEWMGGPWFAGPDYSSVYLTRLVYVAEAWNTATTDTNLYEEFDWYKNFPIWIVHSIVPNSGNWCRWGDVRFADAKPNGNKYLARTIAAIRYRANENSDADTADLANYIMRTYNLTLYNSIWNVLWDDPGATQKSPGTVNLSLSKRFQNLDWVYMRSSWDEANATYVSFICSPYFFANHDSANANSFVIYKKGPLAIRSGCYENGDKWFHERNYQYRTVAHNSVTVYDTDEQFFFGATECSNDGGQKWYGTQPADVTVLTSTSSHYCGEGVTKYRTQEGVFDYMVGEATKAYDENKIELFEREFAYLRSADENHDYVVVFDRVKETVSNYEKDVSSSTKRWLLHTTSSPTVSGVETEEREGKWSFDGSEAETEVDEGMLFLKVLMPNNFKINKIGGDNPDKDGRDHNFECAESSNYPCGYNNSGTFYSAWTFDDEYGKFRLEVEPTGVDITPYNIFLNVMQASETSVSSMTVTSKIESTNNKAVGAFIESRITNPGWCVMFSTTTTELTDITYTIDDTGNVRHLICDLDDNLTYDVNKNSGSLFTGLSTDEGTLYFEDTISGETEYEITKGSTATIKDAFQGSFIAW